MEERQARISSLQARINEVQDRIFGAFSRRVSLSTLTTDHTPLTRSTIAFLEPPAAR